MLKKKILAILLALSVATSMMPLSAFASDTTIESVTVNYGMPTANASMQVPTVPSDAGYELSGFKVVALTKDGSYNYDMNLFNGANVLYKASMPYYYSVTLKAKSGYKFKTSACSDGIISSDYLKADSVYGGGATLTTSKMNFETRSYLSTYRISIPATTYVYTGSTIRPDATISGDGNGYYDLVSSYSNNKSVGTAKVTVVATGKRSGETAGAPNKTFKIVPQKASISSITTGTKKLTVKMSKAVGLTGGTAYKIGYKVKGGSTWKYVTTTSQTKTITGLTKGKSYDVKVKAYKGNYSGSWSTIKTSKAVK